MTVTIKDVAERAGCGIATVSRVINSSGPVAPEMREKVQLAIAELGYSVNRIARSLRDSTTDAIACLVPSIRNPIYADVVQGLQSELAPAGYQLMLGCYHYDPDQELTQTELLMEHRPRAVVLTVCDAAQSRSLQLLRETGLPTCLIYNQGPKDVPSVWVDNFEAAREAGRRLHEAGHRHMAFVALKFHSSDRSYTRYQGLCAYCTEAGIPEPLLIEIDEGGATLEGELASLKARDPSVTAIFASNDFLAISVMSAAKTRGIAVPGDLSVIGFDGIEVGRLLSPSLATIQTRSEELGRNAGRIVLEQIAGAPPSPRPSEFFSFRDGGSLGGAPPGSQ